MNAGVAPAMSQAKAAAAEGDELDVARTGLLNAAAGDDALAVPEQDDLEHDTGVVGAGADFVVLELGVQGGEVEFVVYEIVQCEGEAAGDELLTQHDRQQQVVAVLGFVAGHVCGLLEREKCRRHASFFYSLNV